MPFNRVSLIAIAAGVAAACAQMTTPEPMDAPALSQAADAKLQAVIANTDLRGDAVARDQYRNPYETLAFFGLEPDMTVVESLPNANGYYTKILLNYLDDDAAYYGLQYPAALAERIFPERFVPRVKAFPKAFPKSVAEADWNTGGLTTDGAFLWDSVPEDVAGTADFVLHSRSLHHMWRGDEAELAVAATWDLLKPGGVAGVLQHRAKADATDEQAKGDKGYLRQADVIAAFEAKGFVLEASSEINANPLDETDYEVGVWRLLPSLRVEDDAQKEANRAIGETDRMTLKFRKPLEG